MVLRSLVASVRVAIAALDIRTLQGPGGSAHPSRARRNPEIYRELSRYDPATVGAGEAEMRERTDELVKYDAAMVEDSSRTGLRLGCLDALRQAR